jgi:GxxExxY protein
MKPPVMRDDLVYPELSYIIVGCAFEVWNEIGPGHSEKVYQKAFAVMLKSKQLPFKEQVYYSLKFKEETVGRAYLDFLVDDKIVIELKKDLPFTRAHIDQVLHYLKLSKLKLALLINFTKREVKFKRIVNMDVIS